MTVTTERINSILTEDVETYEIPVTLDGLIHVLDFNKYCLSEIQVAKLKEIITKIEVAE